MLQVQNREKSPSIFIPASCRPVLAIGKHDINEALLRHGCPIERNATADHFYRCSRKRIEQITSNDSEVAPARPSACAKQIRILLLIHPAFGRFTVRPDRDYVNSGKPIDSQAVKSRE